MMDLRQSTASVGGGAETPTCPRLTPQEPRVTPRIQNKDVLHEDIHQPVRREKSLREFSTVSPSGGQRRHIIRGPIDGGLNLQRRRSTFLETGEPGHLSVHVQHFLLRLPSGGGAAGRRHIEC